MNRVVHKINLHPSLGERDQMYKLPVDAVRFLHVNWQVNQNAIGVWYETLDGDASTNSVRYQYFELVVVGTGQKVPEGYQYLGTAHQQTTIGPNFVWHVYGSWES